MRDVSGMMHVADIWCDLKYGSAKWNSVLREVLVRYEMCDTVRNDGVVWTVMWFGMSEMVFVE